MTSHDVRSLSARPDRETIAIFVTGGVAFALVALWVYAATRGLSIRSPFAVSTPSELVAVGYVVFGLVLLGGTTLVLGVRVGLRSPVVALVVVFAWTSYATWRAVEAAGDGAGLTLRPDAFIHLFWFVPLGLVLAVGGVEYALRRRLARQREADASG